MKLLSNILSSNRCQVYSSDQYARHKLIGDCDLRLGDLDLRNAVRVWMTLREPDQRPTELGDILFSMSYLPTAERLTVVIVKCRSLRWRREAETSGQRNRKQLQTQAPVLNCQFYPNRLFRQTVSPSKRTQGEQEENFDETRHEKPNLQREHDVLRSERLPQRK